MELGGSRLNLIGGMSGILGIGVFALVPLVPSTPDAGPLEPLVAVSAEETRVEVLGSGRTLGGILQQSTLSGTEQQRILTAFRERANPSRLRAGTEISFRYLRGTERIRGVEVVVSDDEVVRLERGTLGWASSLVRTPVRVDTLSISGQIESDLWTSVVTNPGLAAMPRQDRAEVIWLLDRVFQWKVDFSRQIQRGDSYRMVFERRVRPDGSMRSGRILAAELVNSNQPMYAVWFDLHGDEVGGYYDLEGESIRRAFIRAPLEFRRISSRFSRRRFHPILRVPRPHIGVDYAAATGTPVMATADGVVARRAADGGYGNVVEIRHANGFMTRYAHLNGFARGVGPGTRVRQGQTIGYVGMTGLATGPHLHYEMHRSGSPVDPLTVDIPSGDPIPPSARDRWASDLQARLAVLRTVPGGATIRVAEAPIQEPDATATTRR